MSLPKVPVKNKLSSKFLYDTLLVKPAVNFGQGLPISVSSLMSILPSPFRSLYLTSPTHMPFVGSIGRGLPLLSTGNALLEISSTDWNKPSSIYPRNNQGWRPTVERCVQLFIHQEVRWIKGASPV